MKTFYSPDHALRVPQAEFRAGGMRRPLECPERVDSILAELKKRKHPEPTKPKRHGLDDVLSIHDAAYIDFLEKCWADWNAAGYKGDAFASSLRSTRMPGAVPPREIDGRVGYYCLSAETGVGEGTWEAVVASADVALSAAEHLSANNEKAFALCRPPGHHAPQDMFGGFCFINNAAIATQSLIANGAKRVAILDVDFHHCNGTQDIFYERGDVMVASIHGDPEDTYPYFSGRRPETGKGKGEEANVNYPMSPGTDYASWREGLDEAIKRVGAFKPDALVVSFGADTFKDDPLGFFLLGHDDYSDMGRRIAGLGLPSMVVMEGGYAVEDLGINTVNFIEALAQG